MQRLAAPRSAHSQPALGRGSSVLARAAKASSGKGFGKPQPAQRGKEDAGGDGGSGAEKRIVRDAAALASGRASRARPVTSEEAARGKLDYVQVADWGDGDRSRLGELRLVAVETAYAGSATTATATAPATVGRGPDSGGAGPDSASSGSSAGGAAGPPRAFHAELAQQLKMAEARGALAVTGPPPPPLTEWSMREGRYVQYLTDVAEVHEALEAAVLEATAASATSAAATATSAAATAPPDADGAASSSPQSPPPPPMQCGIAALQHLRPGCLGLERSAAIRRDLAALAAKAAATTTATANGDSSPTATPPAPGSAPGPGRPHGNGAPVAAKPRTAGPMARSHAQLLRRLGREAAGGESEQERQTAALRLLAHTCVLHTVWQAAGLRVGAAATERLSLLQRRAAAAYHEYPDQVADPPAALARAVNAAGRHVRGAGPRQAVFDEVPGAMQKAGLLMTALAHRD